MPSGQLLVIALALLNQELQNAKVSGAAQEIIDSIAEAIASLVKVHGSDVTFDQLEQLRTKCLW
jgi:hypothetical protein